MRLRLGGLRSRVALVLILGGVGAAALRADPEPQELIRTAVGELLEMQEPNGAWPYEGVYRVRGEIPVGYRISGTALVAEALLFAAPSNGQAAAAIEKGVQFILDALNDKAMSPRTPVDYDVRIWGFTCALDLFCQMRSAGKLGAHREQIESWIPRLVDAILIDEIPGGGWNYSSRHNPGAFVTAPVVQTLLLARAQGEKVPDAVLERARQMLLAARAPNGAFAYSGLLTAAAEKTPASQAAPSDSPASAPASRQARRAQRAPEMPGSIARSAVCEATLVLLGEGSPERVQAALDAFHRHWDELEKRRKKTGTHAGPYGIAPYYFYFGHRYAAQAIELLPPADRDRERARLLKVFLRTRDEDGTWNDRVFPRSRNYGTAMIVLGLLGEKAPLPPAFRP